MKNSNKKGFTLVELLVVIAILAILATVAVVGYSSFTEKADKSADQTAVTQMNKVLEAAEALNEVPTSVDEVKELLIANDYNGDLTTYHNGYELAWIAADNVIVLVENGAVVYPEAYAGITEGYKLLTPFATDADSLTSGLVAGETLYVNSNINADDGLVLGETGEYTVNLNGNTINSSYYVGSWVEGSKLVVSNGIINATTSNKTIAVYTAGNATVELNNVQIYAASGVNPVQIYGGTTILNNVTTAQYGEAATSWYNSAIQIANHITQDDNGTWYFDGGLSSVTVNGGMYSGDKAIQMSAPGGTVVINGGTFIGTTAAINADYNATYASQGATYSITINDGNFTGAIKIKNANISCVVNGGTFSVNIGEVANVTIGEGKTVVDNGNGTWTVQ